MGKITFSFAITVLLTVSGSWVTPLRAEVPSSEDRVWVKALVHSLRKRDWSVVEQLATRGSSILPDLIPALEDPNPDQREYALLVFSQLGPLAAPAVSPLMAAMDDKTTGWFAYAALGAVGPDASPAWERMSILYLEGRFQGPDAISALAKVDSAKTYALIQRGLSDADAVKRKAISFASQGLNATCGGCGRDLYDEALRRETDPEVQKELLERWGWWGNPIPGMLSEAILKKYQDSSHPQLRQSIDAISQQATKEEKSLIRKLQDPSTYEYQSGWSLKAARRLSRWGQRENKSAAIQYLEEKLSQRIGRSVRFMGSSKETPEFPDAGRFYIDELQFGFEGSCGDGRREIQKKGIPFRLSDAWVSKLSPENIPCLAESPGEVESITEEERASLALSRKGELAVVEGQGVRLRSQAGLEGTVVAVLQWGEPVTLLESTLLMETIDDHRDLWYKARSPRGLVGWVFGGYLRICGRRI